VREDTHQGRDTTTVKADADPLKKVQLRFWKHRRGPLLVRQQPATLSLLLNNGSNPAGNQTLIFMCDVKYDAF
jgi:hypothetical protein